MKKTILVSAMLVSGLMLNAQLYKGNDKSVISFFSHTTMEDIAAKNTVSTPVLNSATGQFICQVANKGFEFKSALMMEHFNENYIESDKFPYCKFSGKIVEKVDYTKDGVTKITMDGNMDIHGVVKPRKIEGTLTVKGDEVTVDSKFLVVMKDHDIKIPEAVNTKLSENMELTVKAVLVKIPAKN